jgi:hypothetical protein
MKHEDIKLDKKIVKKAVNMHDKQQHGGKKTNLKALKKGGGIGMGGKSSGMSMGEMARKALSKKPTRDVGDTNSGMSMGEMARKALPKKLRTSAATTMKKGGCAKMARGGGCEVRGKTRGRII